MEYAVVPQQAWNKLKAWYGLRPWQVGELFVCFVVTLILLSRKGFDNNNMFIVLNPKEVRLLLNYARDFHSLKCCPTVGH